MEVGLFSWVASSEKGEKKPHPPGAFREEPLYIFLLIFKISFLVHTFQFIVFLNSTKTVPWDYTSFLEKKLLWKNSLNLIVHSCLWLSQAKGTVFFFPDKIVFAHFWGMFFEWMKNLFFSRVIFFRPWKSNEWMTCELFREKKKTKKRTKMW